ncbi:exocyst complex subunit Sec15-like-domain-containing protein [Dipodascopsis tothii]|uniref:exocyst complex subunit Sec15-like-domain-containing protein n=1 Tax=Dipodascopsis tothii TaxID=44089 RepID=UPI0034CEEFDC
MAEVSVAVADDRVDALSLHLQQVLLLNSDPISLSSISLEGDDYLEQLAPVIEDAVKADKVDFLIERLTEVTEQKEIELQELCNNNQKEYAKAVKQLGKVQEQSDQLRREILDINERLQMSGKNLVVQKNLLVESLAIRQSVDETTSLIERCLTVFNVVNRTHQMIEHKEYVPALKSLQDLQKRYLHEVSEFGFARVIKDSIPAIQTRIKDDVLSDLKQWLVGICAQTRLVGRAAITETERRRRRWHSKVAQHSHLRSYKLNSAVEISMDDQNECDPLNNELVKIDLVPLYDCIQVYRTLGLEDELEQAYEHDRETQQVLFLPTSLTFSDSDISPLEQLLEDACGLAILERVIYRKAYHFRAESSVERLWESMCQQIAKLIEPALGSLRNPETLLHVRTVLGLFIQTMESHEYPVQRLNSIMLSLFERYSDFLKTRFANEFKQISMEDDYKPMIINSRDLWEKVVSVSWYKSEVDIEQVTFPCSLPFSRVYPLSCAEIRNFVNQHYTFSEEYSEHQTKIETILGKSLDELLVDVVCHTLCERLRSNDKEEIVQILINLEHFENAAVALERMLNETTRSQLSATIRLRASEEFSKARRNAEKRVFELVPLPFT